VILPPRLILRLLRRFAILSTLTVVGALGFLWLKAPPVLAAYCPPCFGLHRIDNQLWVDSPDRAALLGLTQMTGFARADVDRIFGLGSADVTILVCTTQACTARLQAPDALGAAYGHRAVLITPFGIDPIVLRHELTHAARSRLAPIWARRVLWREEGLAEWVAKGPRMARDCPAPRSLPTTLIDWTQETANNARALYAQAHCQMSREIERHGIAAIIRQP